jgi:hypothetical protein
MRLAGLLYLIWRNNAAGSELAAAAGGALIAGAGAASLLGVQLGEVAANFDLMQCVSAAFFLITIVGIAGLCEMLTQSGQKLSRIGAAVLLVWVTISWYSSIRERKSEFDQLSAVTAADVWNEKVRQELSRHNDGLKALALGDSYFGYLLPASDVTGFWVSQNHKPSKNMVERAQLMKVALEGDSLDRQRACGILRAEGVEIIIGTPSTESKVLQFAQNCSYKRYPGDNWTWYSVSQ